MRIVKFGAGITQPYKRNGRRPFLRFFRIDASNQVGSSQRARADKQATQAPQEPFELEECHLVGDPGRMLDGDRAAQAHRRYIVKPSEDEIVEIAERLVGSRLGTVKHVRGLKAQVL